MNILVHEEPVASSSNIVSFEPSDNDTDCESTNENVIKRGDKSMITESLNKTLNILNQSPITSIHFSSRNIAVQKLTYMQKTVKRKLIDHFSDDNRDYFSKEVLSELRENYNKLTNYDNQLHLLTILPQSWSIRQMVQEIGCTKHMAIVAKQLHLKKGILSYPDKKKGVRAII